MAVQAQVPVFRAVQNFIRVAAVAVLIRVVRQVLAVHRLAVTVLQTTLALRMAQQIVVVVAAVVAGLLLLVVMALTVDQV